MAENKQKDVDGKTCEDKKRVFDYRALRLLMGIIAFTLPFLVHYLAAQDPDFKRELKSISESYYTDARDVFVGQLFVVGAFLWAYNGFTLQQKYASKVAGVAAVFVALFPTSKPNDPTTIISYIHFISAGILFLILTYFCFVHFMGETWGGKKKENRRAFFYLICGSVMALSLLVLLYSWKFMDPETVKEYRIVFWGEAAALVAFGVAWIVSGKYFKFLADDEERLRILLD